ncbi:hypothetical protein QBC40DRAFT_264618 [Triangularia verruculosa]|uniref:Uncharacterized protein n=1 Tax=Triangularia verruculosa TaxID=2587418 RepID=A0AAN7AXG5_9PEZI|nr:hypothetical protein QBC40DRAFT_264618 [Triangularia verruculosa]
MPLPLLALAVPAITAGARAAAPAIGKAAAQGAARNAGKAATKAPAPKPQPPKQNNPPKPKDDKKLEPKKEEKKPEPKKEEKKPEPKKEEKKPEPKKEEQKPGQPRKEEKKPEPKKDDMKPEPKKEGSKPEPKKDGSEPDQQKKDDNKPGQQKKEDNKPQPKNDNNKNKKPTRDREDREELIDQILDTTSKVIDCIPNRPGRDDDAPSDRVKPTGPKPKNPVVAPKAPKAGDLLMSLAVKNNGQDWFWFVHHPTEASTGMTMHAEGTITKGFTVKLTRKTTVDKLKSAAGTKSLELIKLQWVEKRWWDEDMFGANKAAKAEAPFETTAFGVKPPTVTECAPVKESASEMAMDRIAAQIKRKDDKTWILESCEALVRAGALKQNVLTFLEKLKDSYGAVGGKTPAGPNVSPAKLGKQPGRSCGTETPTKGKESTPAGTPTKTGKPVPTKRSAPGKLPAAIPGLQGPGAIMAAQKVAKVAVAANK